MTIVFVKKKLLLYKKIAKTTSIEEIERGRMMRGMREEEEGERAGREGEREGGGGWNDEGGWRGGQ